MPVGTMLSKSDRCLTISFHHTGHLRLERRPLEVASGPPQDATRRDADHQPHVVPVEEVARDRVAAVDPPAGWRRRTCRSSSSKPRSEVSTSSGETASTCTSTAGGFVRPLAVGSENSSETRGLRRTLKALCGSPIEVVIRKRPSSGYQKGRVGQVIGVPSWRAWTSRTSGTRGRLPPPRAAGVTFWRNGGPLLSFAALPRSMGEWVSYPSRPTT
jgi:hypothetical protein